MRILRNFPYKILSLLFAVSFWFFLVIFQNVIYDVQDPVPLEILNNPEGFEIATELPEVQVKVTAPKDEASFLRPDDFQAHINLKGMEEGIVTVPIVVSTKRSNVNIVSYVPQEVEIMLETVKSQSFSVKAAVVGAPSGDYRAGEPVHSPWRATVSGPQSLIDSISYVGHKIILTENDEDTIKGTYVLVAYDKQGKAIEHGLTIKPETVQTELQLTKVVDERSVPVRLAYNADVDTGRIKESVVSPSSIVLRGPIEVLTGLQYVDTVPITREQIESIMTGAGDPIDLMIPASLQLVDGEGQVQVTIR